MNQPSKLDVRLRRRRRLAGNRQYGLVGALGVLALLVAGVFAMGNSPDVLSTNAPFFSGGEPGPGLETGEIVYAASCLACHGVGGAGNTAAGIPALNASGEIWQKSAAEIETIILDGGHIMPGQRGLLSETEIEQLIDYLRSLWTEEQQAAFDNR